MELTKKPHKRLSLDAEVKNLKPHSPSHGATLMRKAVKRPGQSLKRQIKVSGALNHNDKSGNELVISGTPDLAPKKYRAAHVKRSHSIKHFSKVTSDESSIINKSISNAKTSAQALPSHMESHPKLRMSHQSTSKDSSDIFEKALREVQSHLEPPPKITSKKRRRLASTWTLTALALLVVGITISQNVSNIRLEVASSTAGFTSSLPKELPSGYTMSKLNYSKGLIATYFRSNTNSQSYAIIQRLSDWNNQSLQKNYLASANPTYQTEQASGLKVYIYGNHNASWLNNGIWYVVKTNGTLSDNELVKIASSVSS